jgi:uncharacterized protein YfaS (alpha-2-macroglobulin family)
VKNPDGTPARKQADVAFAAVDEALLQLAPNDSWDVLDAMMGDRPISVLTSTAQTQVVGKRHYGKKAVEAGGGGGGDLSGSTARISSRCCCGRARSRSTAMAMPGCRCRCPMR